MRALVFFLCTLAFGHNAFASIDDNARRWTAFGKKVEAVISQNNSNDDDVYFAVAKKGKNGNIEYFIRKTTDVADNELHVFSVFAKNEGEAIKVMKKSLDFVDDLSVKRLLDKINGLKRGLKTGFKAVGAAEKSFDGMTKATKALLDERPVATANKVWDEVYSSTLWREHLKNAENQVDLVNAWKHASDAFADGSKFIADIPTLDKISKLASEGSSFRTKLGNNWQEALDDILKNASDLKCSSCGNSGRIGRSSMDQYLDDVDHFIKNFDVGSGGKGEVFYNWMRNTTNPTSGQLDELHQTIRDFAKRGLKESDVVDIGKQFPIGTKKYDLQQIGGKFTEYKNKDFVTNPLTASSSDVDQFINGYLKNVDNLDKLEWKVGLEKLTNKGWTDANALSNMKSQWKNVLSSKADDMFKGVSEGGLGIDKMKQLFGNDILNPAIFRARLNNSSFLDNALRFIKVE